jgi:GH15 family glucan-1,4-alpha-glucosidase
MPSRIEDYALIGDCQTAALVGRNGSIDWLCFPRFDSPACFAALLGTPDHGRWLLTPTEPIQRSRRSYREGTLVLETDFEIASGAVTVVDCMPVRAKSPYLIRMVVGKQGKVPMRTELVMRFDYGSLVPWVRRTEHGLRAVAGPDALLLRGDVELHGEDFSTVGNFSVSAGERKHFVLKWYPSHHSPPPAIDSEVAIEETSKWWRDWSNRCTYQGEWREAVVRSLITLKALTFAPTGGIVAAPTTSLPEQLGGVRNWDYRFCWLRDATFTLYALMMNGYYEEAHAWRCWLERAVAGRGSQLQIMYGVAGERRLSEIVLDWLPGYADSRPVRIGNAAHAQFQLDVYGEVLDSLYQARRVGLKMDNESWRIERELLSFVEEKWDQPDEGIWEIRGPRRQFTHSKAMAWVAVDRGIKGIEQFGLDGPLRRWRQLRDTIHADVCRHGFDPDLGSFVQSYGSKELDASLLLLAEVGFLPPTDRRIQGTVEAIGRRLLREGFVGRYSESNTSDGLPPGEGAFLLCSFWLADNYALLGRWEDARRLFERLLAVRNDVGLLGEEYDPAGQRLLGNFPQAFSHIGLINTARNLSEAEKPAEHRKAH